LRSCAVTQWGPVGGSKNLLALLLVDASFAQRGGRRAGRPEGYYVLQGTDKPGNVHISDLEPDNIAGLSLRFSWEHLEPERGVYDWSVLDGEIDRVAALGKKVTIRPQAGAFAPNWLYAEGAESTLSNKGNRMPMPWDPVMLDAWQEFISALGERYNTNPSVTMVHLSGPVADSAEMHLPDALQSHPDAEERVFAAWTLVIDSYVQAFRRKSISLNVANPFSSKDGLADSVADYLIGVAGRRATLQMNSLSAKTQKTFNVFELLEDKSAFGTRVGFQMLSGSEQDRFGGQFGQALAIAEDAEPHFFEIYQGDIHRVPQ
jgi:hypothetical protein